MLAIARLIIFLVFVWTILAEREFEYPLYTPENFPEKLDLQLTEFDTWAQDNYWNNTWTAFPATAQDVVDAANWAKDNYPWQLRPSGAMHTWSPITVPNENPLMYGGSVQKGTDGRRWRLVLLKTAKLNRIGIISKEPGNFSFWAEPGIKMGDLLQTLEDNEMGFAHHPAPGAITLGGVLAIGGHGAGIPARNETPTKGHTFGSISNLVISFTAIVYNEKTEKFEEKIFQRTDKDAKAFLVNLGRTFLTNVTLRAGPLQYLRCQSYVDISVSELFANPQSVDIKGLRTFSSFLDSAGRVESILFPFTSRPWLKVWRVVQDPQNLPLDMLLTRKVLEPYNYPFSDNMSPAISKQVQLIKSTQKDFLAISIGQATYAWVTLGLTTFNAFDLWGAAKNLMLYIKPSTLRYHANGYAILTSRENTQRALYESYKIYYETIKKYQEQNKYPINGPLEIRVTGLDKAEDVGLDGPVESPAISAISPVAGRKDLNTVIWFDILTYTKTNYTCNFMQDIETQFLQTFNGTWATFRVEWSKGYAYSAQEHKPWFNRTFLNEFIPRSFEQWDFFDKTLKNYDGKWMNIFSNEYLQQLYRWDN